MNNTLLIFLPSVIVVVFTLILIYLFMNQENRRRHQEIRVKESSEMFKLRMQAYERLTLLLERLNPESLILREQRHDLSALQFQTHLLKIIRTEFDHNLTMQIYVTIPTWEKVKAAKEGLVRLINTTANNIDKKAPALELGRFLIENTGRDLNLYFNDAIASIRKEMNDLYGK
ncbi:DUF7935 family protein [Natronoflexus pectinivorans]|uniref:Uncharacterized protein n=1 Tax=Natronoflexus pectinivorans TaxID=682526 RepID=A0A4R2GFY0_9BACT|nr:hypothetical protein [Natronoflexus pectinivorans]TCO06920.1 hypothetical protein EV194_11136 [Natronoflexus pectinivorans]